VQRGQATAPAPASQRPARTPTASAAGPGWQTVAPGSAGLSAARLRQIADQARQGESNCLVVLRYGKIAGEWYFRAP
jgi:hypothetical protein